MGHLRSLFKPGMRVLDAGCGSGDMALLLKDLGCDVVGLDAHAYAHWEARSSDRIKFCLGSSEAMAFGNGSFDGVISMDALHHMAWPEKALAEMVRVAKAQAPVVVIETNRLNPLTFIRMTLVAGHETFTPRKFFKMVEQTIAGPCQRIMVESRCLPWNAAWLLNLQKVVSNLLEALPWARPWLTYQMALFSGKGTKVDVKIDTTESMAKRQARVESELVA